MQATKEVREVKFDFKFRLRIIYLIPYLTCTMEALRADEPREAFSSATDTFQPWANLLQKGLNLQVVQVNPTLILHPSCASENEKSPRQ